MSKAVIGGILAALVFAAGPRVAAQEVKKEPIRAPSGVDGSSTFRSYCAQCHGIGGRGNGPAAKALKVAPADLTQISKRHEGQFPAADVRASIAGDHAMAAHGTRDMPMWGPVFRSVENASVTELRLVNLVKYLEQLQEK
jgi:mono/diheme cytochrome c family protein